MLKKKLVLIGIFVFWSVTCGSFFVNSVDSNETIVEITTSEKDNEYLKGILKETLDSIMYYRNPKTGIVSADPQNDNAFSKCDHIGLSLASIAVGGKIGLIPDEKARKEIEKTLKWVEKIPTAAGFPAEPVKTSDTRQTTKGWIAVADMGWYPCCLIVVGEAYPEFKKRIKKLLDAMDWEKMYDKNRGFLKGLYSVDDGRFRAKGDAIILASDQRLAIFIAIASGKVPAELWEKMPRYYAERYGEKYLKPGEALGFAEQPCDMSHFIDERCSEVGKSNADMAWVQMLYALDMWYPVWGWSNCLTLHGYMGFGDPDTNWSVVNPHAVAPAITCYPNQVVKAFRKMEKLGIREPVRPDGKNEHKFGLRAGYDVDHRKAPGSVIAGLDQPIIFFSLANYLYDGIVWKLFKRNRIVRHGIDSIDEYVKPKKKYLEIYRKRDIDGPHIKYDSKVPRKKAILIDDFSRKRDKNNLKAARNKEFAKINIGKESTEIEFIGDDKNKGKLIEDLGDTDLTHYRALKLNIKGKSQGKVMLYLRISDTGGYRSIPVTTEWNEIIIPFRSFYGGRYGYDYGKENPDMNWTAMWYDRTKAKELVIEQMDVPVIEIKDMSFITASKEDIDNAASDLVARKLTKIEADGTFDRMETIYEWYHKQSGHNTTVTLDLKDGFTGKGLVCNFSLGESGGWVLMGRKVSFDLEEDSEIVFRMKSTGGNAGLEVKLIDSTGAAYLTVLQGKIVAESDWQEIRVPVKELKYGWGGEKNTRIKDATELHFAVTSTSPVRGEIIFDDLKLE
ncbi:MAG: hypothetical protein JW983_06365 [Elusimicrobia bacterium]|nr:hypothetical protein [Elusimicrobiota bacterium]